MFDKHHKKENPTFTGITRGVGGFGFGAGSAAGDIQISEEYWIGIFGSNTAGAAAPDARTYCTATTVDSLGNTYVTGYTACTPSGNYGVLIVKFDMSGVLQWQRIWGSVVGPYKDVGGGITIDNSDNLYVVGEGGSGGSGALILKYNTSGVLQWSRYFGSSGYKSYAVDFDNDGNIYICGTTHTGGSGRAFIAKSNSSGIIQWHRTLEAFGTPSGRAYDVVVDRNNDVLYMCGQSKNTSSSTSNTDATLTKYNLSGVLQWQKSWSGSSDYNDWAHGVALDSSGDVYVTGRSMQLASTNPGGQGSSNYDGFLVRYNSSGVFQSDVTFGGNAGDEGNDITINNQDTLFVCGKTGSGDSNYNTGNHGLIMRFTTGFYSPWQRGLGGSGTLQGTYKITVDDQNVAIYTAGTTTATGPGSYNGIVTKLPLDGTGTGAYDTPSLDYYVEPWNPTSTFSASHITSTMSDVDKGTSSQSNPNPDPSDYASSFTFTLYNVSL